MSPCSCDGASFLHTTLRSHQSVKDITTQKSPAVLMMANPWKIQTFTTSVCRLKYQQTTVFSKHSNAHACNSSALCLCPTLNASLNQGTKLTCFPLFLTEETFTDLT